MQKCYNGVALLQKGNHKRDSKEYLTCLFQPHLCKISLSNITGRQKNEVGLLPLNALLSSDSTATITFADVGLRFEIGLLRDISKQEKSLAANHDFGGLKWPKFRASLSEPESYFE